jgi:hypothetical protein
VLTLSYLFCYCWLCQYLKSRSTLCPAGLSLLFFNVKSRIFLRCAVDLNKTYIDLNWSDCYATQQQRSQQRALYKVWPHTGNTQCLESFYSPQNDSTDMIQHSTFRTWIGFRESMNIWRIKAPPGKRSPERLYLAATETPAENIHIHSPPRSNVYGPKIDLMH